MSIQEKERYFYVKRESRVLYYLITAFKIISSFIITDIYMRSRDNRNHRNHRIP